MTSKRLETQLTPELACSNIRESLNFYTNVLGFTIQYQRKNEGFVMLERQGSRIMLDEIKLITDNTRTWISAPLELPFGRGINLQIKTKQVDKLYYHIKKMDANIFLSIETKWYRAHNVEIGLRQFIVLDPDGYMLRFAEELGDRS